MGRIYRPFELLAQGILIINYGIDSSDVGAEQLKSLGVADKFIDEQMEPNRNDSGKIQIGMYKDFLLLKELGNSLGKKFIDMDKSLQNLLSARNYSILAHGLNPINKEQSESLLQKIKEYYSESIFCTLFTEENKPVSMEELEKQFELIRFPKFHRNIA